MVFEWVSRDLRAAIGKLDARRLDAPARSSAPIPPAIIQRVMREVLRALALLQRHRVVHRDIRPENILVSDDWETVRVADLGLARYVGVDASRRMTPGMVTLWYRAPEILAGSNEYSVDVDMWSLACVFFELVERRPLFPRGTETAVLSLICTLLGTPDPKTWGPTTTFASGQLTLQHHAPKPLEDWAPNFPAYCGDEGIDLFLEMLDCDPRQRIDAVRALEHPYFSVDFGGGAAGQQDQATTTTTTTTITTNA
jgi:serine/threonine protein kinase